jgi:hypothetical protein
MIANINTYTDLVKVIDYVISTDDIAAISMSDRGEALRMLSDRGVTLEPAGKGVICFCLNGYEGCNVVIEIQGDSALIRRMEEADFDEVMLNEMAIG